MKLFFITPSFSLILSFALCMICASSGLFAQTLDTEVGQHLSAELTKEQVVLTWVSLEDFETDYFEIERSLDGRHWEALVQIEGTGKSASTVSYQTIDMSPYEGQSFYRLVQTDYEGERIASATVEVLYEVPMEEFFTSQTKAISNRKKNQ